MSEFDKVYLDIEGSLREKGEIFGNEWDDVRKKQILFLLDRPLILKVRTEKVLGQAGLDALSVNEWWEAEQEERKSDKMKEIGELADMTLLFLTSDSIDPNLMTPSQVKLLETMAKDSTVKSYCEKIGITEVNLVPVCIEKIKINELRNPPEAFTLVSNEDMEISKERMNHNYHLLKKNRDKIGKRIKQQDWWKKTLYIDEGGWIREKA